MNAKKIISIYKKVIFAINKLELKQDKDDKCSLVYPFEINELISSVNNRHHYIHILNTQFLPINKKNLSLEKVFLTVFYIDADLRRLYDILEDDLIDLCCCVSSRIIHHNDYEKNLNPHLTKKIVFNGEAITEIYKDVIKALHAIELQALKKSLINADAMIQAIENVEPDINLLSEGIAIVNAQRKWTYYDIVLIMTRFHCGLTRLLYVIRDIQDAIDTLNEAIEREQKLIES
jgi:hypothetical protein